MAVLHATGQMSAARTVRVLSVDSDESARHLLQTELGWLGYDVRSALTAAEALALLGKETVDAILVNVDTPMRDGPQVVRQLLGSGRHTALLVLSSANDAHQATDYLHIGAADYVVRPAELSRLQASLERALKARRRQRRRHQREAALRNEVAGLTLRLRRRRANVARASISLLESLVHMMELRDRYLAGHSVRVAQLAASLAAEWGKAASDVETVRAAGRLHDIGMLCIGDGILSKAGPLTVEEFAQVKQHVTIGDELLRQLPRLGTAARFVRSHHERWDGAGYPDGRRGEGIPWGAQLIAAAEVYDALTTARPYKNKGPLPAEAAAERIEDMRGTVLSPDVCDAIRALVRRGRALVFIPSEDESRQSVEAPLVSAPTTTAGHAEPSTPSGEGST